MFHIIFGIILILLPLVGVLFYSTAREGFLKITACIVIFHLALSIITQGLHIFTYTVIIGANAVFSLVIVGILYVKTGPTVNGLTVAIDRLKSLFVSVKHNWIFIFAVMVIFLQLVSVHKSYSGIVQTIRGQETVSDSAYTYPYFSDEWVTVSEIKYSIENNALPLVNPLDHGKPFSNVLFAFPSVLAEIFLILGLNPLVQYWFVSVFFDLVLCVSLYLFLKINNVASPIAAASMLCIPYIANSGDLPALWSLLPFNFGSIFLLGQLSSQRSGYGTYVIFYSFLAVIFYPPMAVFSIPVLCVEPLMRRFSDGKNDPDNRTVADRFQWYVVVLLLCIVVFLLIYFLTLACFDTSLSSIMSKYIIRPNLDPGIISYAVWNVIPWFVIVLSIFGIYEAIKKKSFEIITAVAVGLLFWLTYAFVNKVFIIEYPRIVFITSLLLIAMAGFGCERLVAFTVKTSLWQRMFDCMTIQRTSMVVGVLALILSVFLLPSYTSVDSWKKLTMTLTDGHGHYQIFIPAPAVNRYLITDDLNMFKGIIGKTFISPPWKGLVIGVATDDFPLETKSSTITNKIFPYSMFMALDCKGKNQAASKYNIAYVYSDEFSCPRFIMSGSSSEGLYLYKYRGN